MAVRSLVADRDQRCVTFGSNPRLLDFVRTYRIYLVFEIPKTLHPGRWPFGSVTGRVKTCHMDGLLTCADGAVGARPGG